MNILDELRWRGLYADCTDLEALSARLATGPMTLYCGFDPTADSLHVGNLVPLLCLRRFQQAGHVPLALAGGATGMIGDPSGRSSERNLLTPDVLKHNIASIKEQLARFLDFDAPDNAARLVDNFDWFGPISYLEFLRDVGKYFTVNAMVAKESVRARMEDRDNGISYTEFSYMLLQAYDFYHLRSQSNCELQIGATDQWGNITAGIDLIRKTLGRSAFGLTWPLVTKSDGSKFGKTADGAVWLDARRTSPYQFRQFWMQLSDIDIEKMLPQFSLRSMDEINEILTEQRARPESRVAQRTLARELTELLHGEESAVAAEQAADVLFGANPISASPAALHLIASEVAGSAMGKAALGDAVSVLVLTGLATSNTEARRLLTQRSVRANGEQIDEHTKLDKIPLLHSRWLLLRKGKTAYHLIDFQG